MNVNVKRIKLQKINKYKMPIYDYPYTYKVMYSRNELVRAIKNIEMGKIKPLIKNNVLDNFNGIRQATQEEINNYVRLRRGYNLYKWYYYIGAIYTLLFTINIVFFDDIDDNFMKISATVLFILFAFLIFYIGTKFDKISFDKNKVKNSEVYIADCNEYDFNYRYRIHGFYPIKVHDGNKYYINEWIYGIRWYKGRKTKLFLYVFKYKDCIDFGVLSEYDLKKILE